MTTTIDGSAGVTTNIGAVYNGLQTLTAQNSTSGTNIDFTGIPSWAKRITIIFQGVSTSGSSQTLVQLGSGTILTSGYLGTLSELVNAGTTTPASTFSIGFLTTQQGNATYTRHGIVILTNLTGNVWVAAINMGLSDVTRIETGAGSVSLSGALDRVRITTVNGTDTFDAGSINVMYE